MTMRYIHVCVSIKAHHSSLSQSEISNLNDNEVHVLIKAHHSSLSQSVISNLNDNEIHVCVSIKAHHSSLSQSNTVWRVIFGGAKFREKSQ